MKSQILQRKTVLEFVQRKNFLLQGQREALNGFPATAARNAVFFPMNWRHIF